MNSRGFLTIVYDQQEKVVLSLFLATNSIKDPSLLQAISDEATQLINEVYRGVYKRIENVPVYDFSEFEFYEYGLIREDVYCFTEDEIYDSDLQAFKTDLFRKHLIEIKQKGRKYTYPRNIVGAVARDNNFYGQQKFISKLWQILNTKNIFLNAPRRFGKTSVMYQMYDNPYKDWQVVHLELQHIASPDEFVNVLTSKTIKDTWKEEGSKFFENLGNKKILFLLDEFLYMLENFDEKLVPEFSKWFQEQRQNQSFRFLIASSISLNFYLKQQDIEDNFTDFVEVKIPSLSEKEAIGLIDEVLLSENVHIGLNLKKKILDLVGTPVPYFIQMILAEVLNYYATSKEVLTEHKLIEIYTQRILGPDCKQYFNYFFQRLSRHTFEFQHVAYRLLKELSEKEYVPYQELFELYKETSLKDDKVEFEAILTYLEDEFYIQKDEAKDTYSFFCKILKDWWQRHGRKV